MSFLDILGLIFMASVAIPLIIIVWAVAIDFFKGCFKMNYEHLCYDYEKAVRIVNHGAKEWITYKCELCNNETTYPHDPRQGHVKLNEESKSS